MNIEVIAAETGAAIDVVENYLNSCDEVFSVPGGALVRRGNVLHLHSPQHGLSGRALVSAISRALDIAHKTCQTLICPVRKGNFRAVKFVERFGFTAYSETVTHTWFKHTAGDAQ